MRPEIARVYQRYKRRLARLRSKSQMFELLNKYRLATKKIRYATRSEHIPNGYTAVDIFDRAIAQSVGAFRRCINYRLGGTTYGNKETDFV